MADPKSVAKRVGPHRTVMVDVETVELAPGYQLVPFGHTEMSPTGLLKVLELIPLDR